MSLNSLTEAEVRRQPRRRGGAGRESDAVPPGGGADGGGGGASPPADNALSMLVKYIPTESITLYVASASAVPALKNLWPKLDEVAVYCFFGVVTPILFALILIGKRKAAGIEGKALWKNWPWWKNIAATIAFFVWALAVPGLPDIPGDTSGAIAGVFALFISTFLSILEPIFDRPPAAGGA
jgi:hypothetical protein